MTEAVFVAEPSRLLIAAAAGIVLLLLIIKNLKSPGIIPADLCTGYWAWRRNAGSNAGKHSGKRRRRNPTGNHTTDWTGFFVRRILEVSGGAQCVAQTLINKFGEKKAESLLESQDWWLELRYSLRLAL